MNFSLSALVAGFVYGVWGIYILRRAKKGSNIPSFVCGLVLLIYPYFIGNIYLLWSIGAAVIFVDYKIAQQ